MDGFSIFTKMDGSAPWMDESAPWIGWECSIKVDGFYEKPIHSFQKNPSFECFENYLFKIDITLNRPFITLLNGL